MPTSQQMDKEADEVFEIAIWHFCGEKSPIWQFFDEKLLNTS